MTSRPISADPVGSPGRLQGWRGGALPIAAAILAGLLLRLWFVAHAGRPDGDSLIYGDIAKSWLQHGIYGFAQDTGLPRPTLIRLPGYPLFLAICFRCFGTEHYNAVLFAQVAVDLFTCLILAALAGRLFGRRAALAAIWLGTLCPFTAAYTARALAETLSLASIATAFYAFYRWQQTQTASQMQRATPYNRWLYLLAASLSYAYLLRPEQVLLAAAILPAMLWIALRPHSNESFLSRSRPVVLTAILVVLPLVPWTIRNARTFHVFQPLAPRYATDPGEAIPNGFQDWYRTWGIDFASTETAYWNYNGSAIAIGDLPARAFDTPSQYAETSALLRDYNRTTTDSPALNARFEALARERIAAHPVRYYVTLPIARVINMIFRPRVELLPIQLEWWQFHVHPGQTIFSLFYGVINLAYIAFAAAGLYCWRKLSLTALGKSELPPLAWAMIASVALRSAMLLTLDNSEPRYTLQFFPVMIVCATAVFARSPSASDYRR